MARHLQQMLSAKGSSPAGSAHKLQHQNICDVNVQAWAGDQKIAASLGFTSGWLEQGQHCWVGVSAQAGNQERVHIENFWPLGPWVGFSGNGRKWSLENNWR